MVFLRSLSPFSFQNPSPGNGATRSGQVSPPQFNLIRITSSEAGVPGAPTSNHVDN